MLLALKWLRICVKALWHWTIPPFCRVRQESIRKIRARPFLYFFDAEKMHLEMQKSEISLGSRTSSCCLPCLAQRNKIEPWVSQHTHLESLFKISVRQKQSEVLQGVWRRRGEKCRRTHFRPHFFVSEFYENWCAARLGRVHRQLCYSLFWFEPRRASYRAKKSEMSEKCHIFCNITYAIVQFGHFCGWFWKPKPFRTMSCHSLVLSTILLSYHSCNTQFFI